MNFRHRLFDQRIIIGMLSGGLVSILIGVAIEFNISPLYGGLLPMSFALGWAVWSRIKNGRGSNIVETWEENHYSTIKFFLSILDSDYNDMKPILDKLEYQKCNVNNKFNVSQIKDTDEIKPSIFRDRFETLPTIQNMIGIFKYEQYVAIHTYIKCSMLFIDSICKGEYQEELLESRAVEAKKIIGFFGNMEDEHISIKEWKKTFEGRM